MTRPLLLLLLLLFVLLFALLLLFWLFLRERSRRQRNGQNGAANRFCKFFHGITFTNAQPPVDSRKARDLPRKSSP